MDITLNFNPIRGNKEDKIAFLSNLLQNRYGIKFSNYKPTSLDDIIDKFFYDKLATSGVRGGRGCSSGRSRSLIDFYLIQKYYLQEPLTFTECHDIYFEKLCRFTKIWAEEAKKTHRFTDQVITQYIDSSKYYYCSTVRRNVFTVRQLVAKRHTHPEYVEMVQYLNSLNKTLKPL